MEVVNQRLSDLERRTALIEEELRANRPVLLAAKIDDLAEDVKGLRRAVVGSAITVAISSIGFALTVLLAFGGS